MESNREWLERHLKVLRDIGREVDESDKSLKAHMPTYDKGPWTGLKLICLNYYLPVYLNILGKSGRRVGYVDVFSGPGLNRIGQKSVPVPGSPTISVVHHRTKRSFNLHIFGDSNSEYTDALDARLNCMAEKGCYSFDLSCVCNDCDDANSRLKNAPNLLGAANIDHCLLFIDPEGLELKWSSLEYFANNFPYSDWIILFPSSGLTRLLGRSDQGTWTTIRDFIGPGGDELNVGSSSKKAIGIYRKNLAGLGKEINTEIMISGGGSFHYHLIPAVRRTGGENPWFNSLIEAKSKIEALDGEALELVSQQIDGTLGKLDV